MLAAAAEGDLSLANRLGKNRATQFYFTNVHKLHSMTPEFFASNYLQFVTEANRIREDYLKEDQQTARITTLESKLDEALAIIQALQEAQPVADDKATQKASKAKAKAEPDAEPEDGDKSDD